MLRDSPTHQDSQRNLVKQAIQGYDWLLVFAVAPLMLFPKAELAWLLLLYPLVLGLQWWAWGEAFPLTPFNPAILLMAVMVGVSLFVTPNPVSSMGKVSGVLLGLLVFSTVARHSRTSDGWKLSLKFFALAGMGVAALGMLGILWVPSRFPAWNALIARIPPQLVRLPGAELGINANEVGGALVWAVPFLVMAGVAFLSDPNWFARRSRNGNLSARSTALWI